jgi:hypothetical protein
VIERRKILLCQFKCMNIEKGEKEMKSSNSLPSPALNDLKLFE